MNRAGAQNCLVYSPGWCFAFLQRHCTEGALQQPWVHCLLLQHLSLHNFHGQVPLAKAPGFPWQKLPHSIGKSSQITLAKAPKFHWQKLQNPLAKAPKLHWQKLPNSTGKSSQIPLEKAPEFHWQKLPNSIGKSSHIPPGKPSRILLAEAQGKTWKGKLSKASPDAA